MAKITRPVSATVSALRALVRYLKSEGTYNDRRLTMRAEAERYMMLDHGNVNKSIAASQEAWSSTTGVAKVYSIPQLRDSLPVTALALLCMGDDFGELGITIPQLCDMLEDPNLCERGSNGNPRWMVRLPTHTSEYGDTATDAQIVSRTYTWLDDKDLHEGTDHCVRVIAGHIPDAEKRDRVMDYLDASARGESAGPQAELDVEPDEEPGVYVEPESEPVQTTHKVVKSTDSAVMPQIKGDNIGEIVQTVLKVAGLPPLEDMIAAIEDGTAARRELAKAHDAEKQARREVESLRQQLADAASHPAVPTVIADPSSTKTPEGKVVMRRAGDMWADENIRRTLNVQVPTIEWEHDHPDVPTIDPHYIFRPEPLLSMIHCIARGTRVWFYGDTGSGKTTLPQQVCAHLNLPFRVISFDSEITRMDLIGRDVLTTDPVSGASISKFVSGVLPRWISSPGVVVMDEVDFCRPDVAYVAQRLLEHHGLVLTEDGGRVVTPHPLNRIVACANTNGLGDDGRYPGSRPQSLAFLNRFTTFCRVPYLSPTKEVELAKARVPGHTGLPGGFMEKLQSYIEDHRKAFDNQEIMAPLTPRNICSFVQMYVDYLSWTSMNDVSLGMAFMGSVSNGASNTDRSVINGLANRIFGMSLED